VIPVAGAGDACEASRAGVSLSWTGGSSNLTSAGGAGLCDDILMMLGISRVVQSLARR
jgi:hypothetical protein